MKHPIIITSKGKISCREKPSNYGGIISQYLASSAGRQALARSIASSAGRTRLDYQGIARKIFLVQPLLLPQGASPTYFQEPQEGYKHDVIKINSRGVVYIKQRRFNLIDRAVQKTKNEIMAQEDSMIFEALDKLGGKNGSSNC